jgi:hypothetical protein
VISRGRCGTAVGREWRFMAVRPVPVSGEWMLVVMTAVVVSSLAATLLSLSLQLLLGG